MRHVWLTNFPDPQSSVLEVCSNQSDPSFEQDFSLRQRWLSQKAIGEPKPIDGASIEQLKAQGYVGVYKFI